MIINLKQLISIIKIISLTTIMTSLKYINICIFSLVNIKLSHSARTAYPEAYRSVLYYSKDPHLEINYTENYINDTSVPWQEISPRVVYLNMTELEIVKEQVKDKYKNCLKTKTPIEWDPICPRKYT